MSVYQELSKLGITLSSVATPAGAYVPSVSAGNLLYLSGHLAKREGKVWTGRLGETMTTEEGVQAARAVAVDLMSTLHAAVGDLDTIRRIVKVVSLVSSTAAFAEHHLVTNGASELLARVFGDRGSHTRSAFGVTQLPLGACIEIELIAQL